MTSECPAHEFHSARSIVRCAHIGSRYVIELICTNGWHLVLYCDEQREGGSTMIEPASYRDGGYTTADGAWDHFVARMRADDPPA